MVEAKELIGLDVGQKRTGIARASSVALLAEPLTTQDTSQLPKFLKKLIQGSEVEAIVVGLPRNLSGDDTAQTTWVRDWVDSAKKQLNVPFYWQDEALTSHAAQTSQLMKKQGVKADLDSLAAAIILQNFLDTPEPERVIC